jgi:DNA-binding phage protein
MEKTRISEFDISAYLGDPVVVAEYLAAAAADPNPDVLVAALGDVAKTKPNSD